MTQLSSPEDVCERASHDTSVSSTVLFMMTAVLGIFDIIESPSSQPLLEDTASNLDNILILSHFINNSIIEPFMAISLSWLYIFKKWAPCYAMVLLRLHDGAYYLKKCMCMCVYVYVCLCVCVSMCMCVYVYVFALATLLPCYFAACLAAWLLGCLAA